MLNLKLTTRQGINYVVHTKSIPLYLKVLSFLNRHFSISSFLIFFKSNDKVKSTIDSMVQRAYIRHKFEPFPWKIQSEAMLFSLPQMALCYFLIPFAILGLAISVRYRLRESVFLIIYFLIMTSALAVFGGNIGTIFRFRDVITPILLVFSSVGLISTFNSLNLKIVDDKVLYKNGLKNFIC